MQSPLAEETNVENAKIDKMKCQRLTPYVLLCVYLLALLPAFATIPKGDQSDDINEDRSNSQQRARPQRRKRTHRFETLQNLEFISHSYDNGDRYDGTVRDNLLHGYGRYEYGSNQELYMGEFVDDAKSGMGSYSYSSGTNSLYASKPETRQRFFAL